MPRMPEYVEPDAASDARANAHEHTDPPARRLLISSLKLSADGVTFLLEHPHSDSDNIELSIDDIMDEPVYLSRTTAMILGSWLCAAAAEGGE